MPVVRSPRRALLATSTSAALAFVGLQLFAPVPIASANADGTGLVIREVYGGGGTTNGSAAYKTDFVELYNPTDAPLSVDGLSLQSRGVNYAGGPGVEVLTLPDAGHWAWYDRPDLVGTVGDHLTR